MLQVRLYATLRAATGGGRVELPAPPPSTVGEALDALVERFPDLRPLILTGPRQLRPMIAVMVDGRDIRHLEGLDTPLADAATLDIFPPVAGGAEVTRTLAIRGLPEWLIRDYLGALGARPGASAPPGAPVARLQADGWCVSWTQAQAHVPGSALALTEFTVVFTGEADAVAHASSAFLVKAQRGGG